MSRKSVFSCIFHKKRSHVRFKPSFFRIRRTSSLYTVTNFNIFNLIEILNAAYRNQASCLFFGNVGKSCSFGPIVKMADSENIVFILFKYFLHITIIYYILSL